MVENVGVTEYERLMEIARSSRKKKSVNQHTNTVDQITNNSRLSILQNTDDCDINYYTCLETTV